MYTHQPPVPVHAHEGQPEPRPMDPGTTPKNPSDAAILAEALSLTSHRRRTLEQRMDAIGGLPGLLRAGAEAVESALPRGAQPRLEAVLALLERSAAPEKLQSPVSEAEDVVAFFSPRLRHHPVETVWVLNLDARGRPIGTACIATGTLTACMVHPREVFATAIRARAAQIILVHNHPSGDPEPSEDDFEITRRVGEAGQLLGIPLLDHIIISRSGHRSLGAF